MAVFRLRDDDYRFPSGEYADKSGLLAVGGDLSVGRLINAYINGIFPWYNEGEPIMWYCPQERFLIFPEEIHISHSMRKFMKRTSLKVTFDEAFPRVIHLCRSIREHREGTWITDDMERAYNNMFKLGLALSCEVWEANELVGGLYGVRIGKCFFGESMFSLRENASKLALISLAKKLQKEGFRFIDCQMYTKHLESMGGRFVPLKDYLELIKGGIKLYGKRD